MRFPTIYARRRPQTSLLRCLIRTRSTLLWSGLVILVAIGVITSIAPGDEIPEVERRFADSAAITLLHVIPGGVLLILGLLQFSPRIRNRHLNFHRWSGREFVAAMSLAIASG